MVSRSLWADKRVVGEVHLLTRLGMELGEVENGG